MTESSRFFSDGSYYTQEQFAKMIKDTVTNGYVPGVGSEFAVSAKTPTDMSVSVGTGRAYINGYIHEIEYDAVSLTVPAADTTNPRIDLVVARLSTTTNRNIRVAILQGTAAASPVEPTLTQTDATWEVKIASIAVAANATSITSSDITYAYTRSTNTPLGMYPRASASDYGYAKIGSGLSVSDGVVSLSAVNSVFCENTSTTNSSGFMIGEMTFTYAQHTLPITYTTTSGQWINIGSEYTPAPSTVAKTCKPFVYDTGTDAYTPDIAVNFVFTSAGQSSGITTGYGFKAIRVSDGSELATITGNQKGTATITLSVPLPDDWSSGEKIQFMYYIQDVQYQSYSGSVASGDLIGNTSTTVTIYYNPVLEEVS